MLFLFILGTVDRMTHCSANESLAFFLNKNTFWIHSNKTDFTYCLCSAIFRVGLERTMLIGRIKETCLSLHKHKMKRTQLKTQWTRKEGVQWVIAGVWVCLSWTKHNVITISAFTWTVNKNMEQRRKWGHILPSLKCHSSAEVNRTNHLR